MSSALADRLERVAARWTVRLTHHGRKTGTPYHVTIWFVVDGEVIYLETLDLGRQWPRNLLARPEVELDLDGETFSGRATPVRDLQEMERVAQLAKSKYPIMYLLDWGLRLVAWASRREPKTLFRGGFFRVELDRG